MRNFCGAAPSSFSSSAFLSRRWLPGANEGTWRESFGKREVGPIFLSIIIELRRILQPACVVFSFFLKQTTFLYIRVGKFGIGETDSGLVIYFLDLSHYLVYVCVFVCVM